MMKGLHLFIFLQLGLYIFSYGSEMYFVMLHLCYFSSGPGDMHRYRKVVVIVYTLIPVLFHVRGIYMHVQW